MTDNIVLAVVVSVALIAHIWIFKWVRFKIDEATIISFIKEQTEPTTNKTDDIALSTQMSAGRVSKVCNKSKTITLYDQSNDCWTL